MVALLLVLSACGQQKSSSTSKNVKEENGEFPKVITHLKGETKIEKKPKKIVTTNFVAAEHLWALGLDPVATGGVKELKNFPIYKDYIKKDLINLGDFGSPLDYEAILEQAPDLIIANDWDGTEYEKLSQIAPTIVLDSKKNEKVDFDKALELVADAVGEKKAFEDFMKNYNEKITESAKLISDKGMNGKTALFMMAAEEGNWVYNGLRTSIYFNELGLTPIDQLQKAGQVDIEALVEFNPDIIFLAEDYTNPNGYSDKLQKNPVWKSLTAVKENHVYKVDTSILGPMAIGQLHGVEFIGEKLSK